MTDMLDLSSPVGFDVTRDPATMTPPQRRREIIDLLGAAAALSACLPAGRYRRREDQEQPGLFLDPEAQIEGPFRPAPTPQRASIFYLTDSGSRVQYTHQALGWLPHCHRSPDRGQINRASPTGRYSGALT